MNWLNAFVFAVLLLSLQYAGVQSRKHSSNLSKSPWADPKKTKDFMDCLIKKINGSDVLPQQEKEDMETLVESLMSMISGDKTNSVATQQAMNMAIASALAELVVAEDADDPKSIEVKTGALVKSLQQCFKMTMHKVNRKFIHEIKDLIQVFVKEAAEEKEESEDEDSLDYKSENIDDTYEIKTTLGEEPQIEVDIGTSQGNTVPAKEPSDVPFEPFSGADMTPTKALGYLKNSNVLSYILSKVPSPTTIKSLLEKILLAVGKDTGLDNRSATEFAKSTSNRVLSIRPGSPTSVYVNSLSGPVKAKLLEMGYLKKPKDAENLLNKFINLSVSQANLMGVKIPKSVLDIDLQDLLKTMNTPTSYSTSGDTLAYQEEPSPASEPWGASDMPSEPSLGVDVTPTQVLLPLGKSTTLTTLIGKLRSPGKIRLLLQNVFFKLGKDMGMDSGSARDFANNVCSPIMSVKAGSPTSVYVNSIMAPMKAKLLETGYLSKPGNAQNLINRIINLSADEGRSMGVNIPKSDLDSDVLNVFSLSNIPTSLRSPMDKQASSYPEGELKLLDSTSVSVDSKLSLNSLLNSGDVVNSPEARARVNNLSNVLLPALSGNTKDSTAILSAFQNLQSTLKDSGMSSLDATLETLMELYAALVKIKNVSGSFEMKAVY